MAGFGVPVTLGRKPGAAPLPSFDLLNLPRPPARAPWAYVKVAEGCDKACGFCAIPSFRGPAAVAVDRRRSSTRSTSWWPAGPRRSCWSPRTSPATAATRVSARRTSSRSWRPSRAASPWVRLLYLYPSELTDAARRCDPRHRGALLRPVAAARVARRCCGACAGGATASGSSTASTPSAPGRPTPPSDRTSSSATPARPRPTTTSSSPSSRPPSSTGAASSPTRRRTAPTPPSSTARCRARWSTSGSPSSASGRTPSPRPGVTTSSARSSTCWSTSPGWPGATVRRRRSTASSPCPSTSRSGTIHRVRITGAEGPDSFAEPLVLVER